MKIGSRWKVGEKPPAAVPESMVKLISEHEATLDERERRDYTWTLSWMEGHPNVAIDDGTEILWDTISGQPYTRSMC